MPPKRTYKKRRPYKPRMTRAVKAPTIEKRINSVHAFKRSITTEIGTVLGVYAAGFTFLMSAVPNSAEFTALYDFYRINKVVIRLVWRSSSLTQIETVSNSIVGMPICYHVTDTDDATSPASASEVMEHSKHRMYFFGSTKRVLTKTLYPRYAQEVFRTGVTSGYAEGKRGTWIDCAYPNVEHYAWKIFIDVPQSGTGNQAYFDVQTTYYLEFKDPR